MFQKLIQNTKFPRAFHLVLLLVWLFIWRNLPNEIDYDGDCFSKRALLVYLGIALLIFQIIINKKWSFAIFHIGLIILIGFEVVAMVIFFIENDNWNSILKSNYVRNLCLNKMFGLAILFGLFGIYHLMIFNKSKNNGLIKKASKK